MRCAIFFDRDGTLNEEVGYAGRPEDFHIYPWAAAAVRAVNEAGWAAVLVTNQAGVARGYFSEAAVRELHQLLTQQLATAGAHLDAIYHCPHHPEGVVPGFGGACECRKPEPGMVRRAQRELDLDLARSWVIGDRQHDVGLAHAVGGRAVLVRTGYGERELEEHPGLRPDFIADDALAACRWILAEAPR
ncbi:MAG: D-glycero-alpha-D-manno-heptose-1,7-bisphosphate 7-phosphatase [Terriglobales bacterium]